MASATSDPFGLGNSASSDKFAAFDAYVSKLVEEDQGGVGMGQDRAQQLYQHVHHHQRHHNLHNNHHGNHFLNHHGGGTIQSGVEDELRYPD
ncbi:hypothetical protein ElyMa_007020900, partial [Elysia marginata]